MKKIWIALTLAAAMLAAGCGNKTVEIPQQEPKEVINQAETDFYTVDLAEGWQWEVERYAADIPTGDVVFYDQDKRIIGGGAIVMAPEDSLKDLPEQIKVLHEETTTEGWIAGKIEVVGNAAGGDTSSEYHVLIPLNDDRQMHEYIDLHVDGRQYDQQTLMQMAETVVLRNQQIFGFVKQLAEDQLTIVRAQWVDGSDTAAIKALGLTEEALSRGFAIVPIGEEETLAVSPEVAYYLVDAEDQLFKEVSGEAFTKNLQTQPDEVYDVTLRDGKVVTVEERLL